MSKDVILDRYARLYEIPYQLAKLGHQVKGWCLDYYSQGEGAWSHDVASGALHWESRSLGRTKLPTLAVYPYALRKRLRLFRPELLIGASDIPHVALARWLSHSLSVPYMVDLYDNFEGFGQARIPGFVGALRLAIRDAGLVTTTSEPLRYKVLADGARGKVVSMPSSVDRSVFYPGCRVDARKVLGLPIEAQLIGTAGGLYRAKGIGTLYAAWPEIAASRPDTHLVLAGPVEPGLPPPSGPRVHYLGHLAHTQIADLFRALDVGVISILDTPFGRYCFPQKAYEMLACGLPVVAADVGQMRELFSDIPQLLFPAGDARTLAAVIMEQLNRQLHPSVSIRAWAELVAGIEPLLRELVAGADPR